MVEEGSSFVHSNMMHNEEIPDFSIGNGSYSDSELHRRGYSSDDTSVEEEKDAMDTFCNRVAATSIKKEGNQAFRHGNFVRAWRCYTAAIHLDPTEMIYFLNRAATHYKTGDFKNCILDCQQAVRVGQIHSTNPRLVAKAHIRCGRAQMRMGQRCAAENSVADALALSPQSAKARALWIQLHHRQLRDDEPSWGDTDQHPSTTPSPENGGTAVDDVAAADPCSTEPRISPPTVNVHIPLPAAPAGSALSAIRSPRFERTTEYAELTLYTTAAGASADATNQHSREDETSDVDSSPEWDDSRIRHEASASHRAQEETARAMAADTNTVNNPSRTRTSTSTRSHCSTLCPHPNAAHEHHMQQQPPCVSSSAQTISLLEESAREAGASEGNIQLNASVLQFMGGEESDMGDDDEEDSLDHDSAPEEMMSDVDSEPRFGYDSDNDDEPPTSSSHGFANHLHHDSCGPGPAALTWRNVRRQRHFQGSLPDPGRPGHAAVVAALEDFHFQNMMVPPELGVEDHQAYNPCMEDDDHADIDEEDNASDNSFEAEFEDDANYADDEADDDIEFEFHGQDADYEDLYSCSDAECNDEIQDDSNEVYRDEQEEGHCIHIHGHEESRHVVTEDGDEVAGQNANPSSEVTNHVSSEVTNADEGLESQNSEGEYVSPLRSHRSARTYSNLSVDSVSSCASSHRLQDRERGKKATKFVRHPRPLTFTELEKLKAECYENNTGHDDMSHTRNVGGEAETIEEGENKPSEVETEKTQAASSGNTERKILMTSLGGDAVLEERIKADIELMVKVSDTVSNTNLAEKTDSVVDQSLAPFADRIFAVFSSPSALSKSFPLYEGRPQDSHRGSPEVSLEDAGGKEDARKSTAVLPSRFAHAINVDEVARAYECIYSCSSEMELQLLQALELLCMRLSKAVTRRINNPQTLQQLIIILVNRRLMRKCYQDVVVPKICSIICQLQRDEKECLLGWWQQFPSAEMDFVVELMNFALTFQLRHNGLCDETYSVLRVLELLNCANDISGTLPISAFYNKTINDEMDLGEDYCRWRASGCQQHMYMSQQWRLKNPLSICNFPFILDAAAKAKIFHIDAAMQMQGEVEAVFLQSVFSPTQNPFLVLRIRRMHIVSDALQQLAACRAEELKRPLKVHFEGEEGIDEGGVQKEFFQIIVRELFDVNFGMFETREDSDLFTFNPHSYESDAQFQLIGTVLGLALYNGVILDVRFPRYVYRKLMGISPNLDDLAEVQPDVAQGLRALLEFEGDVEDTFLQTFTVSYEYFGDIKTVELKTNGANISVSSENREEFVALFVEHKLQESVHRYNFPLVISMNV